MNVGLNSKQEMLGWSKTKHNVQFHKCSKYTNTITPLNIRQSFAVLKSEATLNAHARPWNLPEYFHDKKK